MSTMNFKEFFWAFTFPKQKIKIRRQSFNSPWMTKGLGKSSKKKRRLYKQFLKNRNLEKELNYKQYKTLFKEKLSFRSYRFIQI